MLYGVCDITLEMKTRNPASPGLFRLMNERKRIKEKKVKNFINHKKFAMM